ncbi:MAG TPA: hypothetical protein VKA53_06350 [Thermoanaerobaculia bacterium]|nr:hypothetical protein [Thermoanaerobaculia bacterium]
MERRRLITWASSLLAILVFGMGAPLALCGPESCSMMQVSRAAAHSCCERPEKVDSNCCGNMDSCDQAAAPLPTVAELALPAVASSLAVVAPLAEGAATRAGMTDSVPTGSPPALFTLHGSLLI